jgi:hypothetical protein
LIQHCGAAIAFISRIKTVKSDRFCAWTKAEIASAAVGIVQIDHDINNIRAAKERHAGKCSDIRCAANDLAGQQALR